MNGINYLADTNCFIYLLDEDPLIRTFADYTWAFSYITEIEILSKKDLTKKDEVTINNMLDRCLKIGHENEISHITIQLRRKYSLKIPDAIIAATALFAQLPLLTGDKIFSRVEEIDTFILEVN